MILHKIQGYIQTIYLIEYSHGLLLLDGCSRPDVSVIEAFNLCIDSRIFEIKQGMNSPHIYVNRRVW